MQGELTEVRTAAARSGDAARALVSAAEKLAAVVERAESRVLDLDAKSDRLARLERELAETESLLQAKKLALADAKAAYDAFLASVQPR